MGNKRNKLKIVWALCPTAEFLNMKTFIIVSLTPDPTVLWAVFISYAQARAHTHARLVMCLGFVTYLHHCCVTTAPPLLCCLIVSIHPRQLYLKPPSDISAHVSSPYSWDVYLYPSLLFLCSRVTGLSFFVVVAVAVNLSFGNLPICQAGVLHSPSHTKKGKKGGRKDNTKLQIEWSWIDQF